MSYIEAVVDSVSFGRHIRAERLRVKKLYRKVQKAERSNSDLEQEAQRCARRLQKLLNYAERHRVMSSTDRQIAIETSNQLEEIEKLLKDKRPWWRKFLDWLAQAIDFVRNLLAIITPTLPILPSGLREPIIALLVASDLIKGLLPPAEQKKVVRGLDSTGDLSC